VGDWTLDPLQLAPLVFVGVAYGVRARTLARRGTPVPRWRVAFFSLGLLLLLAAIVSPVAQLGDERFSFHMVQHILLGDLAPLALLAGRLGSGPGAGLTWLWAAFGVGFIGSRAVVLLHRARGTAWMVTGG
jgi:cytochrome c oxidase assembly factor CtaG